MKFAFRNSSSLLNTDYKKISSENDDTMEEDYREFTEERILEMLSQDTVKKVRSAAKTCGVSTKGTKVDILMRIKSRISNENEKFKKLFTKLWGHSGGWLMFSCLHSIVYM